MPRMESQAFIVLISDRKRYVLSNDVYKYRKERTLIDVRQFPRPPSRLAKRPI